MQCALLVKSAHPNVQLFVIEKDSVSTANGAQIATFVYGTLGTATINANKGGPS